jgi:hypothetical protein
MNLFGAVVGLAAIKYLFEPSPASATGAGYGYGYTREPVDYAALRAEYAAAQTERNKRIETCVSAYNTYLKKYHEKPTETKCADFNI